MHPDTVIAPYDVTLKDASQAARRQWTTAVLAAIDERVRPIAGDLFEIQEHPLERAVSESPGR